MYICWRDGNQSIHFRRSLELVPQVGADSPDLPIDEKICSKFLGSPDYAAAPSVAVPKSTKVDVHPKRRGLPICFLWTLFTYKDLYLSLDDLRIVLHKQMTAQAGEVNLCVNIRLSHRRAAGKRSHAPKNANRIDLRKALQQAAAWGIAASPEISPTEISVGLCVTPFGLERWKCCPSAALF